LVGFYLNVTYDPNPPCNLKILEIKKDDILQLNRSLGDPWKQYSEKKILTELKKESGALHWRVKPEHIIPINRPIKISPKIFNTANRHITSPTGIDKSTFINLKRLVGENIFSETHLNKSAGIKQPDIAKRQEIENTAMEAVKRFYKKSGFNVIDVSDQCKGWDYEATKEYYTIYIEVKGRSSNDVSAELTPNEYQKMKDNKEKYVLCIVTSALIKPELHIFKWQSDNRWLSEKGKVLHFNEKIGAEVSI